MSSTDNVFDCESENEPRLAKKRRSSIIKHESTEVSVLTEKDNNRKSECGQRKSLRGVRRVSFASTDQVREFCQDDEQHVHPCTKMKEAVGPVQSENTSMVLNKHTKPAVQCFQTFVRGAIPDLSQNDQSIASGNTTANLAMTPQQVVEKCDFKDVMMRLNLSATAKWSNASSISSAVECADPSGTIKQAGPNQSLFMDGGVHMDPSQPNPPKRRCQLQPLVLDDPLPLAFIPTRAGIKYEQVLEPKPGAMKNAIMLENEIIDTTRCRTMDFSGKQAGPKDAGQFFVSQTCAVEKTFMVEDDNMATRGCHKAASSKHQVGLEVKGQVFVPNTQTLELPMLFEHTEMSPTKSYTEAFVKPQSQPNAPSQVLEPQICEMVHSVLYGDENMDLTKCHTAAFSESQPSLVAQSVVGVPQSGALDKTTVFEGENVAMTRCHTVTLSEHQIGLNIENFIFVPQTREVEKTTVTEDKKTDTSRCRQAASFEPQTQSKADQLLGSQTSAMEHSIMYGDENMEMTRCHTAAFSESQTSLVAQSVVIVPQSDALEKTTVFEDENMAMTGCHTMALSDHQTELDAENVIFGSQTHEVKKTVGEDKKMDLSLCSLVASFEPQPRSRTHDQLLAPQTVVLDKTTVFENCNMDMTRCHSSGFSASPPRVEALQGLIVEPQTQIVEIPTPFEHKEMNTTKSYVEIFSQPQPRPNVPSEVLVPQISAMEHSVVYGDENMEMTKCHTAAFSESQPSLVAQSVVVVPQSGALDKTTVFEDANMAMTRCHTVTLSEHQIGLDVENFIFVPQTREVEKTTVTEDKKTDTSRCCQAASFEPQTKSKADQLLVPQTSAMEHSVLYGDENMDMTKCHTAAFSESQSSFVAQSVVVPQSGALDKTTVFEDENMAMTGCHTVTLSEHQIGLHAENFIFVPQTREVEKITVTEDKKMDTSRCRQVASFEPHTKSKADQLLVPQTSAMEHSVLYGDENMDMTKCHTAAFSESQSSFVAQSVVVVPQFGALDKTTVFEDENMAMTGCHTMALSERQTGFNAENLIFGSQTREAEKTAAVTEDKNMDTSQCDTAAFFEAQPRLKADELLVPLTGALLQTTVFLDDSMDMTKCDTSAFYPSKPRFEAQNLVVGPQTQTLKKKPVFENKDMSRMKSYTETIPQPQPWLNAPSQVFVPQTSAMEHSVMYGDENMELTRCHTAAFSESQPRLIAQSSAFVPRTRALDKTTVFCDGNMSVTACNTAAFSELQAGLEAESRIVVPQTCADEHSVMFKDVNVIKAFSQPQPRANPSNELFESQNSSVKHVAVMPGDEHMIKMCGLIGFARAETTLQAEDEIFLPQTLHPPQPVIFDKVNVDTTSNNIGALLESHLGSKTGAVYVPKISGVMIPALFEDEYVDTRKFQREGSSKLQAGLKAEGRVFLPPTRTIQSTGLIGNEDADTMQSRTATELQPEIKAVIENLDTTFRAADLSRRQHDGGHVERSSKYRPKVVEPSLPGENKNCSSYSHQNIVDGVSDFGILSESMPFVCDTTLGNTGDFASAAYDQDAECSLSKMNSIGDKEGIQTLEVLMRKLFADLRLHVSDFDLKHKSPACLTEQTKNSEQIQGVTGSRRKSHLPGNQCSAHQLFIDDLAQNFSEFETSIARHDVMLSRLNGRLTERQVTRLSDELPVAMSGLYRKAEGAYAALHKRYRAALRMEQQVELEDLQKKSATANELICDLQRAMEPLRMDEMKKETISGTVLSKTKEIHSLKAEKADVKARCKEQQKKNTELIKELQEMEQELAKSIHSKTDYWGLSEWRLVNWDDNEAIFSFFFDSLVLAISFGRPLDTELCPAQLHMEVTKVNLVSFLDGSRSTSFIETHASDFARLVHRLLFSSAHMSEWQSQCGDTNQLSQLLLTVSTRVNVARSLFEELEALECNSFTMEIFSIKVEELRVSFVFSSLPAYAKFAIIFNVTPAYPHEPMHFEFRPMIGNVSEMDVKKAVETETPGRYYLWRLVNQVYHSVLLPPQKKCSTANEPR